MNHTIKMLSLIVLLTVARTGIGAVIGGPIFNAANDHTYYLLDVATWTDSQAEAVLLGGNLATINNQAENDWVFSTFGTFAGEDRSLWIGLTDIVGGQFAWASGEPLIYTNWAAEGQPGSGAEPNNFGGVEHYAEILPPADVYGRVTYWNDLPNDGYFFDMPRGVVEVVPEPSTLVLCSLGGAGLFIAGRRTRMKKHGVNE